MRHRFKILISLIITIFILIPVGAYSIWIFNNEVETTKEVDTNVKIDDIKENYIFGKEYNENTTYTIYFFPSTLYLNEYYNYLDNASGATLPESSGYIEPGIDDSGNLIYDENGNIIYDISSGAIIDNYKNIVSANNSYLDSEHDEYYQKYYHEPVPVFHDNWGSIRDYYELAYQDTINSPKDDDLLIGKKDEQIWYRYGSTYSIDSDTGVITSTSTNHGNQFASRNMHRYNRFGYWNTLNFEEGRYLPIKLTVDSVIPLKLYSDLMAEPFTDMGDNHHWYNYTFSNWCYANETERPYDNVVDDKSLELRPFLNYDNDDYFDIMNSLEKYADENNVIRLFPIFSNGKNYDAQDLSMGGRDAIKLSYEYNSSIVGNKYDYDVLKEAYFTYANEQLGGTGYGYKVNFAYINNFILDPRLYSSINVSIAFSYSNAGWISGWNDTYTFEDIANIDQVKNLGTGLYNFFLFITDAGETTNNSNTPSNYLENMENTATEANGFKSLNERNLEVLGEAEVADQSGEGKRQVLLCCEKISNIKLIKNIDIDNKTKEELETEINNQYDNAPNFVTPPNNIYRRTKNSSGEYVYDENPIGSINKYIYIMRNVDFMDDEFQHLQFRFGTKELENISFDLEASNTELVYDLQFDENNNVIVPEYYQIFEPASEYFELIRNDVFRGLKTKKTGIYDIILVWDNNSQGFKVYTYRHSNLFIKLFSENVGHYESTHVNGGLAKHINDDGSDLSTLIWEKHYSSGETIYAEDISEKDETTTFEESIRNFVASINGNINDYVIRDHVTQYLVAYFDNDSLIFEHMPIRKNYLFYIEKK